MTFKDKMKKAFRRASQIGSDSGSDKKRNSNVYQPGEPMPPQKYRRPVPKEHKDRLDAFSFGNAWRRKSTQSQYSPMGSRLPSRRGSILSIGRRKSSVQQRNSIAVPQVDENSEEEADVANEPRPFNPDELSLALKNTNLSVPAA